MDNKVDETNQKILQLLWENARLSFSEIGKVVHLSAPAVAERIRKMEDAGIITGYRVQVDPAAMGYAIKAFVLVQVWHGQEAAFSAYVQQQLEVVACVNVTGEKAFLVTVVVATIAQLDDLLERFAAFSETNTMIHLSTVVEPRLITQ